MICFEREPPSYQVGIKLETPDHPGPFANHTLCAGKHKSLRWCKLICPVKFPLIHAISGCQTDTQTNNFLKISPWLSDL